MLVLKTGDAAPAVRERVGDYDRWFEPSWRAAGFRAEVLLVQRGARLAKRSADRILITGSPLSVTRPTEWMRRLADELREAADRGIRILGVCFGHQLLAYAYGVPVIVSPRGREIGTVDCQLSEAGQRDWLFAGCPPRFLVQATHEDVPARLPEGMSSLANNTHGLQAMAMGATVRGVQFHPELSPEGMSALIRARETSLRREGRDPDQILAGVRSAPFARKVLENFLR